MIPAAPARAVNLMDALTRQIARVAVIRERYACLACLDDLPPLVNIQPLISRIDDALETAHAAAASGDALTIIRSLRHLEGFDDCGTGKPWELRR